MNKKVRYVVSLLFGFIIFIYFYTLLHEAGHALVAILYGGKIDKLVLGYNAHVQTSDADFSRFGQALFHADGVLLPILFLIIALIVYNTKIKSAFYHICYGLLWLSFTATLLAWVVIPLMALVTMPPVGDDVTKFLDVAGMHPLIVSLSALLIITALTFFMYNKGLTGKIREICIELLPTNSGRLNRMFVVRLLGVIALGAIITVIGFNILMPKPIFEKSISMDVDSTTKDVRISFDIDKSRLYNMNMKLTAKGILTDTQIYDENDVRVYQNICEWSKLGTTLDLKKGKYMLVLTFLTDEENMQEYFKAKGYKYESNILKQLKEVYSTNNLTHNFPITFSVTIK